MNLKLSLALLLGLVSLCAYADNNNQPLLLRDKQCFGWKSHWTTCYEDATGYLLTKFDGVTKIVYKPDGTISVNGVDLGTGGAGADVADAGGDTTTSVLLHGAATGALTPLSDAGLTYNATTDVLTAGGFAGPLTGNVTGNVSGSAGSATGNAATATALAANPTEVGCGSTSTVTAIAANGNLTCTSITGFQASDADLTTWAGVTPGTGVAAALALNVGSAGAPVLFNGAGGTPSAITLTNGTGLPITGHASGTSADLAGVLTDETGTGGGFVRATTPSFTTSAQFPDGSVTVPSIGWTSDVDGTGTGLYRSGANLIDVTLNGVNNAEFASSGIGQKSTNYYCWTGSSTSGALISSDTCMARDAGGVVQFNSGTSASKGGWKSNSDANGSFSRRTSSTEQTTLTTSGVTTVTAGNLAVANSEIKAILVRVTTTITTAASYTVKVTGGNAFCQIGTATTSNTSLTAGNTLVLVPCAHADAYNAAATTLTYTFNANPGAGVVRTTVVYEDYSAPSS